MVPRCDVPQLWQTGSCHTHRCGHVLSGELAIYVAICPYLYISLSIADCGWAGGTDCVFEASEKSDVSGCKRELFASFAVNATIYVCSCMSCQCLFNASVALALSLLVCVLMCRHLLKCIYLASIWPCWGFKPNTHFNDVWQNSQSAWRKLIDQISFPSLPCTAGWSFIPTKPYFVPGVHSNWSQPAPCSTESIHTVLYKPWTSSGACLWSLDIVSFWGQLIEHGKPGSSSVDLVLLFVQCTLKGSP